MFLEFWIVVSVLFVCLFGGLRLCGGVCFVFGFVCLGCWGFSVGGLGGACETSLLKSCTRNLRITNRQN